MCTCTLKSTLSPVLNLTVCCHCGLNFNMTPHDVSLSSSGTACCIGSWSNFPRDKQSHKLQYYNYYNNNYCNQYKCKIIILLHLYWFQFAWKKSVWSFSGLSKCRSDITLASSKLIIKLNSPLLVSSITFTVPTFIAETQRPFAVMLKSMSCFICCSLNLSMV